MTIGELISNIDNLNEDAVIYAKKMNDKFSISSEAILIELQQDELGLDSREISNKYCPGFDYFLEVFLAKDLVSDFNKSIGYKSLDQQIDQIIRYVEFDA